MRSHCVFFIRGLSTYGHDSARFSFLDFGPVYRHLQMGLSQRGLDFHPITDLGTGSLIQLADRALNFLRQDPKWKDPEVSVHLLGHSAGGLVARLLIERLETKEEQKKISSLLTIATPHRGSTLAKIFAEMPTQHPASARWLRALGYDVQTKNNFFKELTPESIQQLLPNPPKNLKVASIICATSPNQWCWPLKAARLLSAYRAFDLPSDGIVERDSQIFGEVIAELPIDHFRQAGFFGGKQEFHRMLNTISSFYQKSTNAVC